MDDNYLQPWSCGDIYPAIISVVETYDSPAPLAVWRAAHSNPPDSLYGEYLANFFARDLAGRLVGRRYVLSSPGKPDADFLTHDEAHAEAVRRLASRRRV